MTEIRDHDNDEQRPGSPAQGSQEPSLHRARMRPSSDPLRAGPHHRMGRRRHHMRM